MKGVVQFIGLMLLAGFIQAQPVSKRLSDAAKLLKEDAQMKYGILGFYVVDRGGTVVYNENGQTGLAAGSAQKVITSTASLDLLGGDYRYTTRLAYNGKISNGILDGNIYLIGSGDPTLGSERFANTRSQFVMNNWIKAIKQAGIKQVGGSVIAYDNFETQTIPGGWIWDDIGNYYGAGVSGLNWQENQFDIKLKSGSDLGDKVSIVTTVPKLYNVSITSELTTGKAGSGDNTVIYLPPYTTTGYIRGTIPPNQTAFTVSGAFPNPPAQLAAMLAEELAEQGIEVRDGSSVNHAKTAPAVTNLLTLSSPSLDSINNWFLKKSINLYGEALVKTLGLEKKNTASTEAGLSVLKNYWKSNGIDPLAINISDGSGLSPENRVTSEALVKVMQFAKSKTWFNSFRSALPEYNGIKMKSGTIGGVKSFTGYVGDYTFAIIVNNFNGSSSDITRKLYKVLDVLK